MNFPETFDALGKGLRLSLLLLQRAEGTIFQRPDLVEAAGEAMRADRRPTGQLMELALPVVHCPTQEVSEAARLASLVETQRQRSEWSATQEVVSDVLSRSRNIMVERIGVAALASVAFSVVGYLSATLLAPYDAWPVRLAQSALFVGPLVVWGLRKRLGHAAEQLEDEIAADWSAAVAAARHFGPRDGPDVAMSIMPPSAKVASETPASPGPSSWFGRARSWVSHNASALLTAGSLGVLGLAGASSLSNIGPVNVPDPMTMVTVGIGVAAGLLSTGFMLRTFGARITWNVVTGSALFMGRNIPAIVQIAGIGVAAYAATLSTLTFVHTHLGENSKAVEFGLMCLAGYTCWKAMRYFLYQSDDLYLRHGFLVSTYLEESNRRASAAISLEAQVNRDIQRDINDAKRQSWKLGGLVKSSLSILNTGASLTFTCAIMVASGNGLFLLPLTFHGYTAYRSARQRANVAIAADSDISDLTTVGNYHAGDASNTDCMAQLQVAGPRSVNRFLDMVLALSRFIGLRNLKRDTDQEKIDYTWDKHGEKAASLPWFLAAGLAQFGRIPWATAGWVCSAIYAVKSDVNALSETATEIFPATKFAQTRVRLMGYAKEIAGGKQVVEQLPEAPEILIENLTFAYPGSSGDKGRRFSLNVPYLRIEPGSFVAVVGLNRSGKSTLMSLLRGNRAPTTGRVLVGGHDLAKNVVCGGHILQGYEPRAAWTVLDNIKFFGGSPHSLSAEQALMDFDLKTAALDGAPHGLDTMIGKKLRDGWEPSGGQKQYMNIAGVHMSLHPWVTLDESTSAVDPTRRKLLDEAMLEFWRGRRTVMRVTHDFAEVVKADRVLYVNNGEIRSDGTHAELLERDLLYRSFYDDQRKRLDA